jgi:hypothetical protein
MFKSFLINACAFVIWCFVLCVVSLAPLFLDQAEAIAAMFAAIVAGVSISAIVFWESF